MPGPRYQSSGVYRRAGWTLPPPLSVSATRYQGRLKRRAKAYPERWRFAAVRRVSQGRAGDKADEVRMHAASQFGSRRPTRIGEKCPTFCVKTRTSANLQPVHTMRAQQGL